MVTEMPVSQERLKQRAMETQNVTAMIYLYGLYKEKVLLIQMSCKGHKHLTLVARNYVPDPRVHSSQDAMCW